MPFDDSEARDESGKWTSGGASGGGATAVVEKVIASNPKKPRVAEQVPSAKAQRAKAAHKMVDRTIQRYAEEHNEPRFADAMKGESYADSEPIDVAIKSKDGKVQHGIELKTMVSNKNNKITMKRASMEKKKAWQETHGVPFHTVVFDDQSVFMAKGDVGILRPNTKAYAEKHDESKRQMYYRRGAGSFRVETMHPVKDLAEIHVLMNTSDEELPKAAQPSKSWLEIKGKAGARN